MPNISCRLSKITNLGPELPYLGVFRLTFEKKASVTFEATSNFSKCKVSYKLKFGTKIASLGVLGTNFKRLMSYLKSTVSYLSKVQSFMQN